MKRYSKKSKKGTTTLFLTIILTAVIFVEITYLGLTVRLDRRLVFHRAMMDQVECFLADYDRELFSVYGIYAFSKDSLDCDVYNNVLKAHGIEDDSVITVSGLDAFDENDLRKVVTSYYAYRSPGMILSKLADILISYDDELSSLDLKRNIRKFMQSEAADVLKDIFDGASEVADVLDTITDYVDILNIKDKVRVFKKFIRSLKKVEDYIPDPDNDFDPSDLSFALDLIDNTISFFEGASEIADEYAYHPLLAHYGTYNFDSIMEDDESLNGTKFSSIHSGNENDIEYILTGNSGNSGVYRIEAMIFAVLFIRRIIDTYCDKNTMQVINTIADVLSVVVTIISVGSVSLPPSVYTAVIVVLYSIVNGYYDLQDVLDGEKISMISYDDKDYLNMGYRDFIFIFMLFADDDDIERRVVRIINRDYEDYMVGINVSTLIDGEICEYGKGYLLYG